MMVRYGQKRKKLLASLGIVLAVSGISCMGVVKGLIGSNLTLLSTLVVLLSAAFLFTGQQLGYLVVPEGDAGAIFLYSVVTLVLSLFSGYSLMQNGYGFVYQAAGFVQLWLLWNMNAEDDLDYYAEIGCWFCGFFCLMLLLLLLSSGSLFVNSFSSGSGEKLFNRSTIGALSFKTFVFSLACRPGNKRKQCARLFFLILSIIVLLASTRRGAYVAAITCTLLHFRNTHQSGSGIDGERLLSRSLLLGLLFAVFLLLCSRLDAVRDVLVRAANSLSSGLHTFFGVDNSDMAASMRVSAAHRVLNQYLHHSSVKQVLFGRGYMTTWVDMPFLQAFWDLGLFGGLFYAFIQFLIPLKYLLRKAKTPGMRVAQYLTVMSIIEGIMSGYPYGRFFSIILLILTSMAANEP